MYTPKEDIPYDKYDEYRLHMEKLMEASLFDFDIPQRILLPLWNAGIRHLGDLANRTKEQLLQVSQIGVVSVAYIEEFLARQNLSLKK